MGTNLHQVFDTLTPTDLFALANHFMRCEEKSVLVDPRLDTKGRVKTPYFTCFLLIEFDSAHAKYYRVYTAF